LIKKKRTSLPTGKKIKDVLEEYSIKLVGDTFFYPQRGERVKKYFFSSFFGDR
jgi:hypothetical protein